MSVGNLKDYGNKGNNFPYQRSVLELLGQLNNASKGVNCKEVTILNSTAAGLESAVTAYFVANPTLRLVAKSVVYDSTASKFVAFLTMSTI